MGSRLQHNRYTLAAGLLYNFGVLLPPAVGAIVMSLSTVIVALNSQTLRKYEPKGMVAKEEKRTVKDPVCGMELEPEMAYSKTEYAGNTYYFCSQQCEENFKKNPEKYAAKLEKKPEMKEHHH